ncbi:MAG: class I SAM-dependent methyltransferase [Methylococcales bacterium]|nr:class I SAM-dependent methyltransferase [Methylococcaceae bacterium]
MNNEDKNLLQNNMTELGSLMQGMRAAYARGENAMEYARQTTHSLGNTPEATLIAYDLQAGTYIAGARANPEANARWCSQLAALLNPFVSRQSSILEVGCGEATTLAGVVSYLSHKPKHALGFDISWSRCAHGIKWLEEKSVAAELFVGDLFEIPLADASVDVVYTSHSLEPNGGREEAAIKELLRVARYAVVLIEPLYELASADAQARMQSHGYVRGLKETAEKLGTSVSKYRLLEYCGNPLNPSGVVLIEKSITKSLGDIDLQWRCPLTHSRLLANSAAYYSPETGVVYPVLAGIPLLRSNHAIVASAFSGTHSNI